MTLQQKLLAKKSKKGFTLVELVVVIAILAILAAIAIPAVVGIIDNAQKSAKKSNASNLDGAAKKLYAGVTAGSINQSSPTNEVGGLDKTKLPEAKDSTAAKRSIANGLTVQDAIDYSGFASTFANENEDDYAFSTKDGTIVYVDKTDTTNFGSLAAKASSRAAYAASTPYQVMGWDTTLGTIYGA